MYKWEILKSKFKILRAAGALFASLLVAVFSCCVCFGWFAASKNVSTTGDTLKVNKMADVSVEVTFYRIPSDTEDTETDSTQESVPSATSDDSTSTDSTSTDGTDTTTEETSIDDTLVYKECTTADLGLYNLSEGNRYCRVLVKFVFSGDFTKLTLAASTDIASEEGYLGYFNGDSLKKSLSESGNSLSSVIQFYALDYSDVTFLKNNTSCTIKNISKKTPLRFFDVGSTITYTQTLELASTTDTTKVQNNTCYVLLGYNEDTMADIFGKNLGNENANGEKVIFNDADFSFEVY